MAVGVLTGSILAGTIGGMLGGFLGKKEMKQIEEQISIQKTFTYAPQTTETITYAPQMEYTYAPQVIISSPQARQEFTKKSEQKTEPQVIPSIMVMPEMMPQQQQTETSETGYLPLLLFGLLGLGAIYLLLK